ncbi:MAG: hypothetical protein EBX41_02285 [Chitinophagia bacterium]|nr:hypothetical protein [Chitinophagia bacterium]
MPVKYLFNGLLILIFSGTIYAQDIKVWNKWCVHADTAVLFCEAYNELLVVCKGGISIEEVQIKSLDRSLKIGIPEQKHDTLSIVAMPYPKYGSRMRLAVLKKGTKKVLKTIAFTAEPPPVPKARLGTITGGNAIRKEVIEQSALRVGFDSSFYSYPYRIKEYTFKVQYGDTKVSIPVKGFFIPSNVVLEIKKAPEGSTIEFADIKATCPECVVRTLDPLRIKIFNK